MEDKMRVIITGGTGLIGRALAESLAAEKHEAIILSRTPERAASLPRGVRAERWNGRTAMRWGLATAQTPSSTWPGKRIGITGVIASVGRIIADDPGQLAGRHAVTQAVSAQHKPRVASSLQRWGAAAFT
jgi:NAD(P)-dependent dehydrogenase (short-subunit alcohol dehydrogenase family)